MAQLNKYQKEIESLLNKSEKDVSKELKALYDDLIKEVTAETIKLQKEIEADDKFSKKLQKERLDSIRSQMQVKSDQLAGKQHDSMFKFLKGDALTAYNELFYDFEMSNKVPLTFSLLPDKQITTIINTPVAGRKLSTRLKGNSSKMKQNMNSVLSRGFSQGWSTQKMAVQIQETGGSTYRRAMTIARTESGRVTSVTRQQSQNHAKELNIEFDKQWISTLDLKTRSDHRELDGQIVGVDEYFKVSGYKALQPHMFGVAAEDCNCRCRTISKLKGYDIKQRRDNESHKVIDYKNYDEWFTNKYPDMVKSKQKGYNSGGINQLFIGQLKNYNLTRDEAIKKLDNEFNMSIEETSRTKLSEVALNQTYGVLKRFENIYNKLPEKIPKVHAITKSKAKDAIAWYSRTWSNTPVEFGINVGYFKDESILKQISKDNVKAGWFSKNDGPDHIMIHEFGHHIDFQLTKVYGSQFSDAVFSKMVNDYGNKYDLRTLGKSVSGYSSYYYSKAGKHTETFAELFAEAYGTTPREIAIDFKKEFEQLAEDVMKNVKSP